MIFHILIEKVKKKTTTMKNHLINDRLLCFLLSFIIFPDILVQLLVYQLDVDVKS